MTLFHEVTLNFHCQVQSFPLLNAEAFLHFFRKCLYALTVAIYVLTQPLPLHFITPIPPSLTLLLSDTQTHVFSI